MSSSSALIICPCATSTSISGTSRSILRRTSKRESTRLCKKNTCPPRSASRLIAQATRSSLYGSIDVSIACRFCGGVVNKLISRIFSKLMWSVRGMGVAESARQSIFAFISLSFSLSFTPKRCSSSIIMRPRFLKTTSF